MVKIAKIQSFKTTVKKSKLPFVEKPLVLKYTTFAPDPEKRKTKESKGLFSSFFGFIDKVVDKLMGTSSSSQRQNVITQSKEDHYLQAKKDEYQALYSEYVNLFGNRRDNITYPSFVTCSLNELESKVTSLKNTIAHEKMMLNLEAQFTKGAENYLPYYYTGDFFPDSISKIVPQENLSYKYNIRIMSNQFLINSSSIDSSLISFNKLSKNYFKEAAISLKEIHNLKSSNRWFEMIPKLGIIPKLLRVNDQIRLTKCLMKDYVDVSENYIEKGIIPLFKKYNSGYKEILKYKEKHYIKAFFYRAFTKKYLDKINDARELRLGTLAKMTEQFAKGGVNINNICENVRKQGVGDLAKKAVISFLTFF